ncbi:hypothetical protein BKH43_00375 [Helicobacter sp. 13S00401-1]|uniref:hypothetical protein n=1 Tax=Helicobacter sp. 13S00401-1 TaxID=1905758 RepID=UPI000BA4E9ED|nr:hypothetical protein [Helicobacter sp. 13S00401-1]PAF51731.1 hypothetical protein BKH43_00375 [Helicobacter sp. 13S00401-1]
MEQVIFIIISFVVIVGLFLFALFKFVLVKPNKKALAPKEQDYFGIQNVMVVLDSRTSSASDLQEAIDKFMKHYDELAPSKIQLKNILIALALHKNSNKDIILNTQKKLQELNPDMSSDLEKAVKRGLDARKQSRFN